MRTFEDLRPPEVFYAITSAEMERWAEDNVSVAHCWNAIRYHRTSAGVVVWGNPFIVVDLPPDPATVTDNRMAPKLSA